MHSTRENGLPIGGMVRPDADLSALQREINRLNSAGNRDGDWLRVEQNASLLLSANMNDLQSHIRFTLARTHLAGLTGLCEGLESIAGLLERHWDIITPFSVHARMTLLTGLSVQLQAALLKTPLSTQHLPLLYQTEVWLIKIEEVLGVRTLKHLIQVSRLKVQISQTINRLKDRQEPACGRSRGTLDGKQRRKSGVDTLSLLPEKPGLQRNAVTLWHQSRAFISGMLVMGIIGGAGLAGNHLVMPERSRGQHIAEITEKLLPEVRSQPSWVHSQPGLTNDIGDLLGELKKSPSSYAVRVRVDYK